MGQKIIEIKFKNPYAKNKSMSYSEYVDALDIQPGDMLSLRDITSRQMLTDIALDKLSEANEENVLSELYNRNNQSPTFTEKIQIADSFEKYCQYLVSSIEKLEKNYSDNELVNNLTELTALMNAGKEFESVKAALKQSGIKLPRGLEADMELFVSKTEAFAARYENVIDYISSEAYQFGAPEELAKRGKNLKERFPELSKSILAAKALNSNKLKWKGLSLLAENKIKVKEITACYDENLQPIEISGESIGKALQEGKTINMIIGDAAVPKSFKLKDADAFPLLFDAPAPSKQAKAHSTMMKFNREMSAIENSKLDPEVKAIKEELLFDQYKLNTVVERKSDPGSALVIRKTVANIMARVAISEAIEKSKITDTKTIVKMNSPEIVLKYSKELMKSGIVDEACKTLLKDGNNVMTMTSQGVYRKMLDAQKALKVPELKMTKQLDAISLDKKR